MVFISSFYLLELQSKTAALVVVEGLVLLLLVGVVLVLAAVVLVVHLRSVLLGVAGSLLAVDPVSALGLGELVDLAADEASKELLGKSVGDGLACRKGVSIRAWVRVRWGSAARGQRKRRGTGKRETYPSCAGCPQRP